jgi:serine/threonine-protein kinase
VDTPTRPPRTPLRDVTDTRTRSSGSGSTPASSSGWLSSSDSINHGRFAPGFILDSRYRILSLLGRGGMGEVYRADDLRLGQPVALKFLPEDIGRDPVRLAQFHNEVRTARQVSHPNICRVHDVGEVDGQLYLSMEYVDGEDLATSLRRIGRFPEDKATDIARQLCAGLAAAHERGVRHRDLKPANVMLDRAGKVRLMDFGLATVGPAADIRAGTPAYMAPEQLLGREVTERSDIFALGLVLYELYTGRRAFTASTIAELVTQHETGITVAPAEIVGSLDPAIDRAILRCLDRDPAHRPASALAVSAALPGGDPLAAALAAGETPSPQMLAAAGEGAGLSPRAALAVLSFIVAGAIASLAINAHYSVLARLQPEYSADVLAEKARDAIRQLGYDSRPLDRAYDFDWDTAFLRSALAGDTPAPRWTDLVVQRPAPLVFWYRESPDTLTGETFHNDLLVPGIVKPDDPPPVYSGMIAASLDYQGRLEYFEAMPPQRDAGTSSATPVNWDPLFRLAGLDRAGLKPDVPQWTWLASSDERAAWIGTWPGSGKPLRVEAAAFKGKPVAFLLVGPWKEPWRMPPVSSEERTTVAAVFLIALAVALCAGGALLARFNLRKRRGDLIGARRLGVATTGVLLALWACQVHWIASIGLFATLLLAVCTSVFYGVFMATTYIALEPFVRRRWPQIIVSWTSALTRHLSDPIVGRDALFGVALGVTLSLMMAIAARIGPDSGTVLPHFGWTDAFTSARLTVGSLLTVAAYSVRNSLLLLFLLFLCRVVLRRRWAGVGLFVALFATLNALQNRNPASGALLGALYYGISAVAVLRWGLVALTVGEFVRQVVSVVPGSYDLAAWYFPNEALMIAVVIALTGWAFHTATAGRWKMNL